MNAAGAPAPSTSVCQSTPGSGIDRGGILDSFLGDVMPQLQDWICCGRVVRVKIDFCADRLICTDSRPGEPMFRAVGEDIFNVVPMRWPTGPIPCKPLPQEQAERVTLVLEAIIRLRTNADAHRLDVVWLDVGRQRLGMRFANGRSRIMIWPHSLAGVLAQRPAKALGRCGCFSCPSQVMGAVPV